MAWPTALGVTNVRVARPTTQLVRQLAFYRDALGLELIGSFTGHAGYDGVLLGLPDASFHLELTQHDSGEPPPAPTDEDLLVLYLPDAAAVAAAVARLGVAGYPPVPSANPYWDAHGAVTIPDADGWRLVLAPWTFG